MPTIRQRYMLTETDELTHALDAAAHQWPELRENRGELLRRIVQVGSEVIEQRESDRVARRRAAITSSAGTLTGLWPEGWREAMRDEWPE